MLPFSIMNTFANNIVKVTVKDYAVPNDGIFVLSDTGDLYYRGANKYGERGDGTPANTANTDWALVQTDVDKVFAGDNCCIIIKTDGTIWSSGRTNWRVFASTEFVNITTWMNPLSSSTIKKIQFDLFTLYVLSTSNVLYMATSVGSRGVMGNGTTSNATTLTQVATGVKEVSSTNYQSFYLSTSNILYGSGWNQNAGFGLGHSTQVNTWTQIYTNVAKFAASYNSTLVITNTGARFSTGTASPNGLGAANYTFVSVPSSLLPGSEIPTFLLGSSYLTPVYMLFVSPTQMRQYGNQSWVGSTGGATSLYTSWGTQPSYISYGTIKNIRGSSSNTYIQTTNGKIYTNGGGYGWSGNTSISAKAWDEVVLPSLNVLG